MGLKQYRNKRHFTRSGEPRGKYSKTHEKRYVIQKHAARHLHYDLRLELDGTLKSWAVPKGPSLEVGVKRLAIHVEDHPIEYANFSGTIPKGQYGAGKVTIWDKGQWFPVDKAPRKAYLAGNMTFILAGNKLNGLWKLIRIRQDDKTWLLIKSRNQALIKPIKWNRPKELKPSPFPHALSPELATLVALPPSGNHWLHELKLDGYRTIAYKKDNKTHLLTRNRHDWTNHFHEIAMQLNALPIDNVIFDGEVVAIDEHHRDNFQLLQNAMKQHQKPPLIYTIFDILYYDQYLLTVLPLTKRKQLLKKILSSFASPVLRYHDHITGSGKYVFDKACKNGFEGIISKRSNSTYIQKRTTDWLKIKCLNRQEFLIGGFTKPKKSRKYLGSLLLGAYNKSKQLVYHGRVGTGFSEDSLKSLYHCLQKITTDKMPFYPSPKNIRSVTWVKPFLVAEVEFTEWTTNLMLRHPRFKGLRFDKAKTNIRKENGRLIERTKSQPKMTMTHPNKVLYPKGHITKQILFDYYESTKDWILPYITKRPLTLVRCPNGYEKHCFYQKHRTHSMPLALHDMALSHKKNKENCIYIDGPQGLMALPQLAVLEIHPGGSRIDALAYPDMIIFDLDPGPHLAWKEIVSAAFEIKKNLGDIKLQSFVKSTGGKGVHIVIPIKPEYEWGAIKIFAKTFADYLVLQRPDKYTNNMIKEKRSRKIYIDYLRNQPNATAIAPYSTRARPYAPVASPIDWDELTNHKRDTDFTIKNMPERLRNLRKDPWRDFFKLKQSLPV